MTKRKVNAAIELAGRGDLVGADEALAGVQAAFVRKRLATLLVSAPDRREAVASLWDHLFGAADGDTSPAGGGPSPGATGASPADARGPSVPLPQRLLLEQPTSLLHPLARDAPYQVSLDEVAFAQMWALVGLATLARKEMTPRVTINDAEKQAVSRFAHAVGLREVIDNEPVDVPGERGRTYKLHRVTHIRAVEAASQKISHLMLPRDDQEELRHSIYYVIVELLRNAIQHSEDPLGGVVGAQLMDERSQYDAPAVQVAVGDAGIGIPAALRRARDVTGDPAQALVKLALEPHVSGTFAEGQTGSRYNAGMGLFFISEMAKLTGGRLLIATRDVTLTLWGDREGQGHNIQRFVKPDGTGFPGTLVAFELPLDGVGDHDALLEKIRERALERTPGRAATGWLRFDPAAPGATTLLIKHVVENTVDGEKLAREQIRPRVLSGAPIVLDFRGIETCTQSFLHALLYEPLRLAWALKAPIHVAHAEPAVRSGLRLVEAYALGG